MRRTTLKAPFGWVGGKALLAKRRKLWNVTTNLLFKLYHKGVKMEFLNAVLGLINSTMLLYLVIKLKNKTKFKGYYR
ncbi:hypothetical protein ACYQHC_001479 [Campylobacter fetus]|uniref:Uncharacterized protein n=1 Tax=Campylobacter fetus TaxID=196 RepID=A0A5L4XP27_CAMFE|nr:hypothetical protein [Campylobacter fetus]EAI4415607.1 hypothetical protein [Campylobacter fetus]EAI8858604.1 hypothetical protein [Campylobacter fetus]EAK0415570.1 hypothetical protein [Campylobacter fetus]EAK0453755.1 hypothetical protein [Campylobacter fetus]